MCSSYTEALIHIFDNDTSGLVWSDEMTVRYRCGQCNELPPVLQFLSANKWGEAYSAYLLADKAVQGNRRIFGNLRKDDCLWKERRY